ncbi:MAG: alpha/beta hydrolase [Dysgonamonadaceae bacterium]|nr:alpha/beta hydrolase [Dysgonamonadaceae bacterium]
MKRILLFFVLIVSTNVSAQNVTGDWYGVLKFMGQQLRLVFHIENTGDLYRSTIDSPDQSANAIPVASTKLEGSTLKLIVTLIGAEYEGTVSADSITGIFRQMGQTFPLNLSRKVAEKEKIIRPQEPVKPYPYHEEEVYFENTDAAVKLAGTLTLPATGRRFPAVVLISGSGQQNRDEELMNHKPFLVLADYLTRNGIAVLRYDDRGTAASSGNFQTATSFDFSKDAEAAFNYLLSRKEIDPRKIGLIGHSEGGMIAPMLAARLKDVAYIVLLAGIGIPGDQLLLLQQELIWRASGIDENDIQKGKENNRNAFEIVKKSTTISQLRTELTDYWERLIKEIPENIPSKSFYDDTFVKTAVEQMANSWMQYLLKYDPASDLEKVKCPVLAINGEKDLQVPAAINLEAIRKALYKGGNKQVNLVSLPGLNHLFQECETGLPAEYAKIEQTFSPVALEEILKWLKERNHK